MSSKSCTTFVHAVHGVDSATKKGDAKSWLLIIGVLAVVAVIVLWVLG